jgi:hypothetical protein
MQLPAIAGREGGIEGMGHVDKGAWRAGAWRAGAWRIKQRGSFQDGSLKNIFYIEGGVDFCLR